MYTYVSPVWFDQNFIASYYLSNVALYCIIIALEKVTPAKNMSAC